jgi:hypothetical protein
MSEAANRGVPCQKPWSNPATAPFNRLPITTTVRKGIADGHSDSQKIATLVVPSQHAVQIRDFSDSG